MKVVSLFDGISCGMIALERAGIKVDCYDAFEINENVIKMSHNNYPSIIQHGDVINADFEPFKGYDLLMGGSPCQSLSITQSKKRENLSGKSKLFFEFVRAKTIINPKYFLFENVASMNEESKKIISECLGCEPIFINSSDFSAQDRKRLYWTNIPILKYEPKNVVIKDILETNVPDRYWYKDVVMSNVDMTKNICAIVTSWKCHDISRRISNPIAKSPTLTCVSGGYQEKKVLIDGRVRKLTPVEYERLQTIPDNYTQGFSNSVRYTAVGNAWTVDVITHILKGLNEEEEKDWFDAGEF